MTEKIVAVFPVRGWRERPVKNFQTARLVYESNAERPNPTVLAAVNRIRKTKRSAWRLEVRHYINTPWMSPADYRAYYNAIADAAEAIVWPEEDVK